MEFVTVDEVNWTVGAVAAYASKEAFVAEFMADSHTYPKHSEARKLAALSAVYDTCVPPQEKKPKAEKLKAPESE